MTSLTFTKSVECKEWAYYLWWYTSVIAASERLRQEGCKFKGTLNNKARPFLEGGGRNQPTVAG